MLPSVVKFPQHLNFNENRWFLSRNKIWLKTNGEFNKFKGVWRISEKENTAVKLHVFLQVTYKLKSNQ